MKSIVPRGSAHAAFCEPNLEIEAQVLDRRPRPEPPHHPLPLIKQDPVVPDAGPRHAFAELRESAALNEHIIVGEDREMSLRHRRSLFERDKGAAEILSADRFGEMHVEARL